MNVEASELAVTSKMRQEYDSIFDSLTGWLNDEMEDITTSMAKDTTTMLRSWEAVRVKGHGIANSMNEESGFKKCKAFAKVDEIQKKWG